MKHLLKLNEYVQDVLAKPKMDKLLQTPMSAEMMLKKIADRYNSLISKSTSEALGDNLGLDDEFLRRLEGQFEPENINAAMQDSQEILRLLASIRQTEAGMSEEEKKEKAMEIVEDIFKGKGFDLKKLEFKLDILNDGDLMKAKHDVIGVPPEQFKRVKSEIQRDNPKLKKELDIRAIQNALTQGFATSIKDDFVMGDNEIEGVSFGDYYSLMDKTFKLYSKVPKALMHQVMTQSPALGRVELVWDEDKDKYVIEAAGYTILILVHEMVKGILELISMHRDPGLEAEDEEKLMALSGTQFSEREGLQYGPGMIAKFKEFFDQVEENLLEQREIREKNPAMMLNVLSRFYKMEDDAFLRACKAIFSDNPEKPYDLFEEFYLDGLEGRGFNRGGDQGGPSDGPSGGPSGLDDDLLRDLLGGAGISLNQEPTYESKRVLDFSTYALLESKKDILDKFIEDGVSREHAVKYIDIFSRYVDKPKGDLAAKIVAAPLNNPRLKTLDDRRNIELYKNDFASLKKLVNYLSRYFPIPMASSINPQDINMAIPAIQDALGLDVTGFYDKNLEEVIKKFQTDFKQGFSQDYDWEQISTKLREEGLNQLSAKEKAQLAMSAQFINRSQGLIDKMTQEITSKLDQLRGMEEGDEKNNLIREIEKQEADIVKASEELDTIKKTLSGGLTKPSGKLDPATLSALKLKKNIPNLPGIKDLGTLQMDKEGEIVYTTENIRIYRATSQRFCIETRKSFEESLVKAGLSNQYITWCISQPGSYYGSYRTQNPELDTTVYFIENIKRANYEAEMWQKYADEIGSRPTKSGYMEWRKRNAVPQPSPDVFQNKKYTKFWDNYNVAVLFVKNIRGTDYYWLVSASNDNDWGKFEQFSFEKVAQRIWPATPEESIRKIDGSAEYDKCVNVTQDIIDKSFYHIPDQTELDRMKNVIITIPWTELEQAERDARGADSNAGYQKNITATGPNSLDEYPYNKKETWLDRTWLSDSMKNALFKNRNARDYIIKEEQWKVLPDPLKLNYISKTLGAPLTQEMFNDIKDKPKLVKAYTDMIKRRLLDPSVDRNLLQILRRATSIKEVEQVMLNDNELNLISGYIDLKEINQLLATKHEELKDITSKPFSVKNLRKKQAKRAEIDALKRLKDQPDLAKLYSEILAETLSNIRTDHLEQFNRESNGLLRMKKLQRSSRIAPIYKEANFRDWLSISGKKLFGDILNNHPGIDSLNTDWETAPRLEDLERDLVAKRRAASKSGVDPKVKLAYDQTIKKFISTLLTGGEMMPDLYLDYNLDNIKKYMSQLENVISYISKMDPNKQKVEIVEMFKRMYIYYDIKGVYDRFNVTNGKYASEMISMLNILYNKFPFLNSVVSKLVPSTDYVAGKSSDTIDRQSTDHTETLG